MKQDGRLKVKLRVSLLINLSDFTTGTTKDYVYDTLAIIHGYTLELRNSPFGFVPPASDIIPVATEAWNGLKAMAFAISAA